MRSIVVYYSLEGNTDYIAKKIAKETGAELLRLETVTPFPNKGARKFIQGGFSVVAKKQPKLRPYEFNASKYDMIILGSPVWAGTYASPLRSFLKKEKLSGKNMKLFMCHSSEDGTKPLENFRKDLKGNIIVAESDYVDPFQRKESINQAQMEQFCK